MEAEPPRIDRLSLDELRARAAQYRKMAATARTPPIRQALLRLAERYEAYAAARVRAPTPVDVSPED